MRFAMDFFLSEVPQIKKLKLSLLKNTTGRLFERILPERFVQNTLSDEPKHWNYILQISLRQGHLLSIPKLFPNKYSFPQITNWYSKGERPERRRSEPSSLSCSLLLSKSQQAVWSSRCFPMKQHSLICFCSKIMVACWITIWS